MRQGNDNYLQKFLNNFKIIKIRENYINVNFIISIRKTVFF